MHEPTIAQPAFERPVASDAESDLEPDPSRGDPTFLQILTTEHWSLLSARGLAYNEAFTRASMLLSFLAMSFVALALLAQGMGFTREMLTLAAILFGFDFVIALTTFARVAGANLDDLRALHGMARIRHAYTQVNPLVGRYFVTPSHDDIDSVLTSYASVPGGGLLSEILYGLSTSLGLVGLILALLGGTLAGVICLALGAAGWIALVAAAAGTLLVFVAGIWWALREIARAQRSLTAAFPAPRRTTD